jgi:hypothetical protein
VTAYLDKKTTEPPPEEEVTLGSAYGPVSFVIKVMDYLETVEWLQNQIHLTNLTLEWIYGMFDFSSMAVSGGILKALIVTTIYSILFPQKWLILPIGVYVITMWTLINRIVHGASRQLTSSSYDVRLVSRKWRNMLMRPLVMMEESSDHSTDGKEGSSFFSSLINEGKTDTHASNQIEKDYMETSAKRVEKAPDRKSSLIKSPTAQEEVDGKHSGSDEVEDEKLSRQSTQDRPHFTFFAPRLKVETVDTRKNK